MSLGTLFKRQYTTVHDIENLTVEDILRIPPNTISTTSIMAEEELFKAIDPIKQAAIKFIAEKKQMRDKYQIRYPTPDEMVGYFKGRQVDKEEARDMVNEARIKDLHNYTQAMLVKAQLQPTPIGSTRKGGKKRSRKQRKTETQKDPSFCVISQSTKNMCVLVDLLV